MPISKSKKENPYRNQRPKCVQVWLTKEEYHILEMVSRKARRSKSDIVRTLVLTLSSLLNKRELRMDEGKLYSLPPVSEEQVVAALGSPEQIEHSIQSITPNFKRTPEDLSLLPDTPKAPITELSANEFMQSF